MQADELVAAAQEMGTDYDMSVVGGWHNQQRQHSL